MRNVRVVYLQHDVAFRIENRIMFSWKTWVFLYRTVQNRVCPFLRLILSWFISDQLNCSWLSLDDFKVLVLSRLLTRNLLLNLVKLCFYVFLLLILARNLLRLWLLSFMLQLDRFFAAVQFALCILVCTLSVLRLDQLNVEQILKLVVCLLHLSQNLFVLLTLLWLQIQWLFACSALHRCSVRICQLFHFIFNDVRHVGTILSDWNFDELLSLLCWWGHFLECRVADVLGEQCVVLEGLFCLFDEAKTWTHSAVFVVWSLLSADLLCGIRNILIHRQKTLLLLADGFTVW